MTSDTLIRTRNFILVLLVQIFIFGQIHLFGYATAYIPLLFILKLPRYTSHNALLAWGFLMGLIIDIAASTPGIHAAATTFVAFMRNGVLEGFIQKGTADDITPGAASIGWSSYISYMSICTILFYIPLYLLELFTISYPLTLLISVAGSTLLTMLFLLVAEALTRK